MFWKSGVWCEADDRFSTVMLDFSTTTASNVIAVALGLLSLVFGVVLPAVARWHRGRRADLEIRFERFWNGFISPRSPYRHQEPRTGIGSAGRAPQVGEYRG